MRTFYSILFLSLLIFSTSCQPAPAEEAAEPNLDEVRAAIQELEDAFGQAVTRKDAEAVAAFYADDAIQLPNNQPMVSGKAAILENEKKNLSADTTLAEIKFEIVDLKVNGDLVIETGKSILTNTSGETSFGKYLAVWEKRDGKYLCIRDISNNDSSAGAKE